ncbi:MAG: SoxR reducing system RseC family protein [Candidatus Symbiothrix sp.]|jgi:sigma-E factor negative regulatory protein RseC|nr:SoxR reducing system RseC family protein [Candidatus Symbiothrix sp.]
MSQLIRHTGIVSAIVDDEIIVDIQRMSACATCESKSMCQSLDSQTQQITLQNGNYNLQVGDTVTVTLQRSVGFYAVLLAFVIPLSVFIAGIIIFVKICRLSEGISALAAFAVVALYYVIIHQLNDKIEKKVSFRIETN